MGFRYQKRIKLGKNFGINISKSGISPSYRTKRGSISTKGYSIRTGIKGLTYRKNFRKAKNSGCLFVFIFIGFLTVSSLNISCKNEYSKKEREWYVGGDLHQAEIIDWKKASDSNKLATCGDFLVNLSKNHSLQEIKIMAINLKTCIDEAIEGHSGMDDYEVAEVASMCLILIKANI